MTSRPATPDDAAAIAGIYNQGIEDRIATFETRHRTASDAARRRGAVRLAMCRLFEAAEEAGFWKLLSRVFTDNAASLGLIRALGFREVGIYEKHGRLDGVWRDVIIVERLAPANL